MSLYDFRISQHLSANDPPFAALIFVAFRKADTLNLTKLKRAFPELWAEFMARYHSDGGVLPQDEED